MQSAGFGTRWAAHYAGRVRETEFWRRMNHQLGDGYARVWADQVVLSELDNRTVLEAIADKLAYRTIWLGVWHFLELPAHER